MRLAVAATSDVALPTLNWLLRSSHELVCVITQPDRPAGRGRKESESPVSVWARENNIKVTKPQDSSELIPVIQALDLVIAIGYGVILHESILNIPRFGFVNLHFSLLPAYRGAAPAQRALENGELQTGISVFQLDKGLDTGPVYVRKSILIDPTWRSAELLEKLSILGVEGVTETLMMIEQGVKPITQEGTFSLAPKISKEDARIDFNLPARVIEQKVKAFTYEPGAWTNFKKKPFKISKVLVSTATEQPPGAISIVDQRVFVACGDAINLELLEVTPSGKQEMKAIEWTRGARLEIGAAFG